MTFGDLNLNQTLLNALADLRFSSPTTIQQKVFSVVMSGRDVCGIAQTGTGKTFAYLLPILRQWQFSKEKTPQTLIIVPTRELVIQVVEAVNKLSTYQSVSVAGAYGGVNIKPQAAEIRQGVDIVVGTPGRLLDLILNGSLKTKIIKKLVIDEMDELLNLGFRQQLQRIIDLLPTKRQNLLFSATITEDVEAILDTFFNDPVRIEAAPTGTPLENIEQTAYKVPNVNTKVNLLKLLLKRDDSMSKVLVFVATKSLADQLYSQVAEDFIDQVGVIHSNKEQNHRFNTINKFKEGSYRFIIATDIIARGIDVSEVTHVVNFDLPEIPEHYIHRIGRTGRADKGGIAISFVTEREEERQEKMESLMKYKIPTVSLPEELEISDVLTADEMPKLKLKNIEVRDSIPESRGASFHEKSAKNSKVPVKKERYSTTMMKKYGKPKTRGQKKK
ncbi:MAG: DEAD/DEAH box helicase [Chitinophagaceae bacterium]